MTLKTFRKRGKTLPPGLLEISRKSVELCLENGEVICGDEAGDIFHLAGLAVIEEMVTEGRLVEVPRKEHRLGKPRRKWVHAVPERSEIHELVDYDM